MSLSKDQELALINATVKLKLKPFGPNKAFNMASLSAHLQNHEHISLTADQISRYFDTLLDIPFFEHLLQRRQRHALNTNNNRHLPTISSGCRQLVQPQVLPITQQQTSPSRKRKSDIEDEDETVESGQEDVSTTVRRSAIQPPPQKRRSSSHPPSTPSSSSSSNQTSRSNTPRPSLRNRANVNYKE